ncbi:alpha/beta fold hydrolase [Nocardioides sp. 503]|uniref:alpha/beta hydrolase n=1 Tax=Nocardioides sp. 503 TaxID=2508326 RepID=UPI001FD6EDF7|nr:alpha/beta fold hydrolase [Nocardioides sp. 503]
MTTTLISATEAPTPTTGPRTSYDEPDGVAARGTLILLTGRGETAAAYARFGRRISADAYKVRVVELDLDDLGAARDRVHELLADDTLPAPRVLVGTDTGATYAAALARAGQHDVDGVVLAGLALPGTSATDDQSWDDELETRSACPAHRRVLSEDADFQRGALRQELPAAWSDYHPGPSGRPTLVLHGSDDPLSPVDDALAPFRGDTAAHLRVVEGGRHDVLNDVTHRSVAATVVLFLERLKLGADLPVIVRADAPERA